MSGQNGDAKRLRELARHTRAMAREMSSDAARKMLREMADRYERSATRAES